MQGIDLCSCVQCSLVVFDFYVPPFSVCCKVTQLQDIKFKTLLVNHGMVMQIVVMVSGKLKTVTDNTN